MGNANYPTPDAYGVQAAIEYYNYGLCGGTPPDGFAYSSGWVALGAGGPGGVDIFQIGFIKGKDYGNGIPQNTVAYFYAYGRDTT